jgi:hypothetical protein
MKPTANTEYRPSFCFIGLRSPLRMTSGMITAAKSVAELRAAATGQVIRSVIQWCGFMYVGSYISQFADSGLHLAKGMIEKTIMKATTKARQPRMAHSRLRLLKMLMRRRYRRRTETLLIDVARMKRSSQSQPILNDY